MAKTTKKKAPAKRPAKAKKAVTRKAAPKPKAPAPQTKQTTKPRDPRLPAAGATIEKSYKGEKLAVQVTADGFLFKGKPYRSLSAIGRAVTGAKSINGPLFFGIATRAPKTGEAK